MLLQNPEYSGARGNTDTLGAATSTPGCPPTRVQRFVDAAVSASALAGALERLRSFLDR